MSGIHVVCLRCQMCTRPSTK